MSRTPTNILDKNPGRWVNRILIGTPTTGLVRYEWVAARYGQQIPTNWSHIEQQIQMSCHVPIGYQVADAENCIAKTLVDYDFEWLLFIEHDNVLPQNTFIKLNQYMLKGDIPIVGALYFTKADPPEPMTYREFGRSYYKDWKMGDKVWCRGIPFGCTLIHGSIIKALWKEASEYTVGNTVTRRVFKHPENVFTDAESNNFLLTMGTTDLQFCKEVVENRIFEKAGWPEYQNKEFPFLIDTSIFVAHIDQDGVKWPLRVPDELIPDSKPSTETATATRTVKHQRRRPASKTAVPRSIARRMAKRLSSRAKSG